MEEILSKFIFYLIDILKLDLKDKFYDLTLYQLNLEAFGAKPLQCSF